MTARRHRFGAHGILLALPASVLLWIAIASPILFH
jgi:hypothetical protein